jgi:hypothetical protein
MLSSMTLSSLIIDELGNTYCFLFFGIISLGGLIFSYIFVKDTTFAEQETKDDVLQTDLN